MNKKNRLNVSMIGACFLCCLCYMLPIFAAPVAQVIKAPVANMYEKPDENAAVSSQAGYGDSVNILQSKRGWVLIGTEDNYQGWVKSDAIGQKPNLPDADIVKVNNLFACIYREPNTTIHQPLLKVPFGAKLPIIQIQDERWIKVQLIDGIGWIQQADVIINAKPLNLQEMLNLTQKFIGLPYLWAGTSTYGFDCSGWVQFLFKQMGIILPRDAGIQVNWPGFIEVAKANLRPGDVLFFGQDKKPSHEAVYLGGNKFINSTPYENPIVHISDLRSPHWQELYITARRLDSAWKNAPEFMGVVAAIPENMQQKMRQYTWHKGCPVSLGDLVYLKMSYWGFDNKAHEGTMIVHKNFASDVLAIFQELYRQHFPIEKMQPIEEYQGDDHSSMVDNNTSAFNCRAMTDGSGKYSIHSYGAAIDVNPLINPYTDGDKIDPQEGTEYLDRTKPHKGKITMDSVAYQIFAKHGWMWGGAWSGKVKDYQHFSK